jgi:hypothetical protein
MGLIDMIRREKAEFHLENIIEKNKLFPRTFLKPSPKEIESLQIGMLVRLIFILEKALKNGCRAERMWVKITNIKNDKFTGVIDNDPYYLKSIKRGDVILFDAFNIATVYVEGSTINEELYAIITKKALENKQVNWVIRTDDINNEQASGWQLFYGDESQAYLDEAKNATVISLKNVLSFEPLLEDVFCSSGNSFEYSKELNKFIGVNN